MALILLVLILAILFGGLGFVLHALWWVAAVVLVLWLVGFAVRARLGTPLVSLVNPPRQPAAGGFTRKPSPCPPAPPDQGAGGPFPKPTASGLLEFGFRQRRLE